VIGRGPFHMRNVSMSFVGQCMTLSVWNGSITDQFINTESLERKPAWPNGGTIVRAAGETEEHQETLQSKLPVFRLRF
jgi:hypothetical protein